MGTRNGVRTKKQPATDEILSYPEVVERYRDQWILMEVTGWGEHHDPIGRVLAHSSRRGYVDRVFMKLPRPSELPPDAPKKVYYVFQAYPRIRTLEGMREVLARLAEEEDNRARRH